MAVPDSSGDGNEPDGGGGPSGSRGQRSNPGVRQRLIRPGILNLNSNPPPSPDITMEEGYHLFNGFMHDELLLQHVPPPNVQIELPTSHSLIPFASPLTDGASVASPRGDNPRPLSSYLPGRLLGATRTASEPLNSSHYGRMGHEIRQLANDFDHSPQGRAVKDKANQVDLECLTFKDLQDLLSGVFESGPFNRTTVVAVFIFCSTLVVRALRSQALKISKNIINWCFDYIRDKVCSMVQQQGGWEIVLGGMVGQVLKYFTATTIMGIAVATCYWLLFKK